MSTKLHSFNQSGPIARLVTQNLVFSAAAAERYQHASWDRVRDLASLIDIFCLYDEVHVLGRDVNLHDGFRSWSLYELFQSTGFLCTDYINTDAAQDLARSAQSHMRALTVGPTDDGLLEKLTSLPPDEIKKLLESINEDSSSLHDGRELVHALSGVEWFDHASWSGDEPVVPKDAKPADAATYVLRTFLYVAYAQQMSLPLTPDTGRMPLLEKAVVSERKLAARLLKRLKTARVDNPSTMFPELRRALSPLAATVFERCKQRSDLPIKMQALRDELQPVRDRLREAEWQILNGTGDEPDKAAQKWNEVFAELERTFGGEPRLLSFNRLIHFGKEVGKVVDKPRDASAWVAAVVTLPVEIIERLVARKPIVELHSLRKELPGDGRLRAGIARIFPDAQPV